MTITHFLNEGSDQGRARISRERERHEPCGELAIVSRGKLAKCIGLLQFCQVLEPGGLPFSSVLDNAHRIDRCRWLAMEETTRGETSSLAVQVRPGKRR